MSQPVAAAYSIRPVGQPFAAQDVAVHPDDQHLLVVRAVEDADAPALRQVARGAPQEVVLQFRLARVLEAEHLAALRIDARHHVLDGAVLAGRIHGLEDQQHGLSVGGVEQLLEGAQVLHMLLQARGVVLVGPAQRRQRRRPAGQVDDLALPNAKLGRVDLHRRFHIEDIRINDAAIVLPV